MSDADGPVPAESVWERGWDGHERAQRLRIARLPLWEKLAWLEEAERVVRHLQKRPAETEPLPPKEGA